MGHRLSKIYTRTGDDGTTGLATGERIEKDDPRVEACGDVDETNSALGLLLAEPSLPQNIRDALLQIQHELFEIGAELSLPTYRRIGIEHIDRLERELDALNAELPPLEEFILPGGNRAAAVCHLARSISRRAERRAWSAAKVADVNVHALRYLNRLSDYLFVMARWLATRDGGRETLWHHER